MRRPFLFSLIITTILWSNRTWGVLLVRIWLLILPDMILRLPAEALLRLSGIRLPREFFGLLVFLGQAGAMFVSLKIYLRLKTAWHRPPQPIQTSPPAPQHGSELSGGTRWKKRIPRFAVVLLGFLIVNSRCGSGAASMFSFFTGSPAYSLPVTTEVSIESPIVNTDKSPAIRRPQMLLLLGDLKVPPDLESEFTSIWKLVASPGSRSFSIDDSMSPRELAKELARIDPDPKSKTPSPEPATRRPRVFIGGPELASVGANIEILLEKAGGGWWQERAGGYLISLDATLSRESVFNGLQASFPRFLFLAENVDDAFRFVEQLTNVPIVNTAATRSNSIEVNFPDDRPGLMARSDNKVTSAGLMEQIAFSASLISEVAGGRIILRDVGKDDIASRVTKLIDERRSARSHSYPDSTLKLFPAGSAEFIARYLDDSDESIIEYALSALKVVGLNQAKPALLKIMQRGRTESGLKVSESLRRNVAGILVRCGEASALGHLEALGRIDRMDVSIWYDERVNIEPSLGEALIQDKLTARLAKYPPMVRPGRLRIKDLPAGVSRQDAALVERLALRFMNAVSYMLWDEKATARLTFSPDGQSARYSLELSHYWGPLAAGANEEYAILVKVGDRWLVVESDSGYSWIS